MLPYALVTSFFFALNDSVLFCPKVLSVGSPQIFFFAPIFCANCVQNLSESKFIEALL